MNYSNIYRKYSLLINIVFFFVLFVFVNIFFKIGFEENDDTVMALIASGSYGGSLDNHLVFINVIYGSFLNLLYYVIPSLEWYTLILVSINIIGVSILCWRVMVSSYTIIIKALFFLFLLIIFLQITVFIQFTVTAAVISIAGIVLINDSSKKLKYIGLVCFVLGSFIRFEATFLVLIITAPIFLIETLKRKKIYFDAKTKFLIVAVIISLGSKVVDYAYYNSNDQWSYYQKFNKIRGKINDNPNARMGMYNLPEGVSKEDYESILSFFIDPAAIDYNNLKSVFDVIEAVPSFTKIRNLFYLHYYILPFFLLILIILLTRYHKEKKSPSNIVITLLCVAFIGIMCFIAFNATVKYRVFFSGLVALVMGLFLLLKEISPSIIKKMILVLVLLMSVYFLKAFIRTVDEKKYVRKIYETQEKVVNEYLEKQTKKLVVYGGDYLIFYGNPFTVSKDFSENQMFFTGWLTHIPLHKKRFDSFTYFIDNYGLFVLKRNYEQAVQQVARGVYLETGIKVTPKIVAESSTDFIVEFSKHNE